MNDRNDQAPTAGDSLARCNATLAWYLGQLDEDERIALASEPGPWGWTNHGDCSAFGREIDGEPATTIAVIYTLDAVVRHSDRHAETAEHIAHHDPARVLREIAARRRRLKRHHPRLAHDTDWIPCAECGRFAWPCPDLRDDLSAYADRPGYREEWRP